MPVVSHVPTRKTGAMDYPPLTPSQQRQLAKVETTTDDICQYAPCRVTLASGVVVDRVYVVDVGPYSRKWGIDPTLDKGKRSIAVEHVVRIESSPSRLPASLANKLYAAGESGMGYTIFVVVMRDGSRLPFLTGGAVDFPTGRTGSIHAKRSTSCHTQAATSFAIAAQIPREARADTHGVCIKDPRRQIGP